MWIVEGYFLRLFLLDGVNIHHWSSDVWHLRTFISTSGRSSSVLRGKKKTFSPPAVLHSNDARCESRMLDRKPQITVIFPDRTATGLLTHHKTTFSYNYFVHFQHVNWSCLSLFPPTSESLCSRWDGRRLTAAPPVCYSASSTRPVNLGPHRDVRPWVKDPEAVSPSVFL